MKKTKNANSHLTHTVLCGNMRFISERERQHHVSANNLICVHTSGWARAHSRNINMKSASNPSILGRFSFVHQNVNVCFKYALFSAVCTLYCLRVSLFLVHNWFAFLWRFTVIWCVCVFVSLAMIVVRNIEKSSNNNNDDGQQRNQTNEKTHCIGSKRWISHSGRYEICCLEFLCLLVGCNSITNFYLILLFVVSARERERERERAHGHTSCCSIFFSRSTLNDWTLHNQYNSLH